jgi:hypothetical protein
MALRPSNEVRHIRMPYALATADDAGMGFTPIVHRAL